MKSVMYNFKMCPIIAVENIYPQTIKLFYSTYDNLKNPN